MIASDHSPYVREEKATDENIFSCGSGMPGIETLRPLMIDAVNKKRMRLKRLVETTSVNPAKRFSLSQKGRIALNADADLAIIDMKKEHTLKNENMLTEQKITVFDGKKIKGAVETTIVRGKIVYDNGEFFVNKGYGEFIRGNKNS